MKRMYISKKNVFCSAGLLYFYIAGVPSAEGAMAIRAMDTYAYLPGTFSENVISMSKEFDGGDCIELFGVIGVAEKVRCLRDTLIEGLRENFDALSAGEEDIYVKHPGLDVYGNCFYELVQLYFCTDTLHYPAELCVEDEGWSSFCLYPAEEDKQNAREDARAALEIWLEKEKPQIMGKQIMTQSFLLSDLVGKKVIARMPDTHCDSWNLMFEGGVKLSIGTETVSYPTKVYHSDISCLSVS